MAQWILVFTPPNLPPSEVARLMLEQEANRVSLSADGHVVDVQRDCERVELSQEDAASAIGEYDPEELAAVLAAIPKPKVFRVSYYRGTALLSELLHVISGLEDQAFVDNDYGVIVPLQTALVQGITPFLASRGGRFAQR